jgi:hypothetical protein
MAWSGEENLSGAAGLLRSFVFNKVAGHKSQVCGFTFDHLPNFPATCNLGLATCDVQDATQTRGPISLQAALVTNRLSAFRFLLTFVPHFPCYEKFRH